MREAGINNPGGMSAILGLTIDSVEEILEQASSDGITSVWIANDNCPGQVVISGEDTGLNDLEARFSAAGAKKVVRLAVSIPSHSPLMAQVQDEFRRILDETPISDPKTPIIGNVHATILKSTEEIRVDLRDQLTSRVRWTDSVNLLTSMGVKTYYELGPGKVLSSLMRRIDRTNSIHAIDAATSFSPILERVHSSI
jgi:[acyl-carrier-protein] S-malonyltransferase